VVMCSSVYGRVSRSLPAWRNYMTTSIQKTSTISYYTTKAGILGFTQGMALQYAPKNIRANCILPGLMNTPMIVEPLKGVYGAGDVEKMIAMRNQQCPTGKMGDAWDVAHAGVFLASDEAKYITGAQIVVDGGISCKMV
jgi:NAD(P)-dependent dehydrogenase (short-subunit alcohol dehydrogenase family)